MSIVLQMVKVLLVKAFGNHYASLVLDNDLLLLRKDAQEVVLRSVKSFFRVMWRND